MTVEFPTLEAELRELKMARTAKSALESAGLLNFNDVAARTRDEVLALHRMGPKALGIIEAELAARGMAFRPG